MKKSELRQIIKEEISKIKEEYNTSKNYKNVVYAISTHSGMFEELVIFSKDQIIDNNEENNDGVYYFIEKSSGNEIYYIDKIEIN